MKKIYKYLIGIFIFFILLKLFLSIFISVPGPYSDYYSYTKMARSFFYFGNFNIHGVPAYQFPPLYPIVLSVTYLFKNMELVFFFMKLMNIILSSFIIFPSFLLAREFLDDKKSLLFSILISVLPSNLSLPQYIMAENLFYPLFLFSIYFMYKSFITKSIKFDILAGLFIGFSISTRLIGVVLIPIFFLSFIIRYFIEKRFELRKRSILMLATFLTLVPLIIMFFRRNFKNATLFYETSVNYTLESFLTLFIFYMAYYILSSGIILFILNLTLIKDVFKKSNMGIFLTISFSSILFSLLIMTNHNSGRLGRFPVELFPWFTGKIIGRYADMILPLIFLGAFVAIFLYKDYLKKIKGYTIITAIIILFSSQIIFLSLFPTNNLSLSWLGFLEIIINYIFTGNIEKLFSGYSLIIITILLICLTLLSYYLIKKVNLKKVLFFLIFIFLIFSLVNYAYNYGYINEYLKNNEQIKLGKWFNNYDYNTFSNVLIDVRDKCEEGKDEELALYCGDISLQTNTKFGFWLNDNILISDVENIEGIDYIISTHNLNYPILYRTNKIYIYNLK